MTNTIISLGILILVVSFIFCGSLPTEWIKIFTLTSCVMMFLGGLGSFLQK